MASHYSDYYIWDLEAGVGYKAFMAVLIASLVLGRGGALGQGADGATASYNEPADYGEQLAQLQGIPALKREEIAQSMEQSLTDLSGTRIVILAMTAFPNGDDSAIYCGEALVRGKGKVRFVVDLSNVNHLSLNASPTYYRQSGCNRRGAVFR